MMKPNQGRGRWLVAVFLLSLVATACGDDDVGSPSTDSGESLSSPAVPATGEPILISLMHLEGLFAGNDVVPAAKAAVEAINSAGGVRDPEGGPNRPFKLVTCGADPVTDPNGYVQCARDAVRAGVVADVGKVAEGADEVTVLAEAGIAMVGTSPVGEQDMLDPHVFPLSAGILSTQGVVAALQAAGASTVGLITIDIPTGHTLAGLLTPVLENKADDLVSQVYLPPDPSADITSFIAQVAGANPDGVLVATSKSNFGQIVVSLRNAGYEGRIGTHAAIGTPDVIAELGSEAEGVIIVSDYLAISDTGNELIRQFNEELDQYAGDVIRSQYALNAWLSVRVLRDVIESEVTEISRPAILAALDGYPVDLNGVAPPFTLGVQGGTLPVPRIPRATVQYQIVDGGTIVGPGDGQFVDLNELVGR
jgi:ABC-type branched-subunit amino acid transport system substrate-binding protein